MIKTTALLSPYMKQTSIIYLDWNSHGRISPAVLATMSDTWTWSVNPASKHSAGQATKRYLNSLTKQLLDNFNADSSNGCALVAGHNIVYTSGATEANIRMLKEYNTVFVSDVEHPSVRECPHATVIPVDSDGRLDDDMLIHHMRNVDGPFLVSYMLANHETGIINDVASIAKLVHKHGGHMHTDAVQAFGRIDIDLQELDVDYMTITAHKCGGPIGIGGLIYRENVCGGKSRMGTVPVPLVAGMVASMNLPRGDNSALESAFPGSIIVGKHLNRLPNTTCIMCNNKTEMMMGLDMKNICISTGSACTSDKSDRAHSTTAMGIPSDTIRISSGWSTKEAELKMCAEAVMGLL